MPPLTEQRHFGIPEWLLSYRKDWLRPDIIAGATAAAVVIPKSMAYASIASLPLQVGLYTAFLPMIIYAFLGTSRVLSVSTTTTIAILTSTQLGEVVPTGDADSMLSTAATLTMLVGAMLVLASFLRLGFIANFISQPVLIGFKAGIGVVIVLDQIPKLLGVHITKGTFLHNLLSTINSVPETKLITLAVGVCMIVLLIGIEPFRAEGARSAHRGCRAHRSRPARSPRSLAHTLTLSSPAVPALTSASRGCNFGVLYLLSRQRVGEKRELDSARALDKVVNS